MAVALVEQPKAKVVLYYPIVAPGQDPLWAPLCMFSLATALLHEGYAVTLIDERIDPDPRGWLAQELDGALFVGVPGKSGLQGRNMEATARFVKERRPDLPVVAGGWFPSLFPHETITSASIDVVVVGPGDYVLPQIADRLLAGESLRGLANVFFKEGGAIVKQPVSHLPRLDETKPIPWDLLGMERYGQRHGWFNFFTSRGCPGGCRFCSVFCLDPLRWTALRPERVVDDMAALIKTVGAQALHIVDTNFCASPARVERLCRLILERGLGVRFHVQGSYRTLAAMSDAQIRLLRRAGCTEIEAGLETGAQGISDSMGKQVDVDDFLPTVRRFVAAGIRIKVNTMLGLPAETRADLACTFRRMLDLKQLGEAVGFQMYRFVPMPGSELCAELWAKSRRRAECAAPPRTYEELLAWEPAPPRNDAYWIDRRHGRDVHRAFWFYGPLVFYRGALDSARDRPALRFVLERLQRLAAWRLAHGVYAFPFEMWLNRLCGRPLPMGSASELAAPEDELPLPTDEEPRGSPGSGWSARRTPRPPMAPPLADQ